jgi:hypothetical protein
MEVFADRHGQGFTQLLVASIPLSATPGHPLLELPVL